MDGRSISELPQDLLHQILSFMNNKQAIQSSIISKEWLKAVRTRPTLVLDPQTFMWEGLPPPLDDGCDVPPPTPNPQRIKKRYIDELCSMLYTLVRYHKEDICLETFTLNYDPSCGKTSYLFNQCLELAAGIKGLRNLNLCTPHWYRLPVPVYGLESLVQLSLQDCNLQLPEAERIMWRNLKRLRLESLDVEEGMFKNIIRACPLIEVMEIYDCNGQFPSVLNFKVENLDNLKKLNADLLKYQTLEVLNTVPNLESVTCMSSSGSSYCKFKLPCSGYRNLKSLSLYENIGISDNFFCNWAQKFPNLEEFTIEENCNLETINISSPSLKNIRLVNLYELQGARFDVPGIVLFEYQSSTFPKLSFTGGSGQWISRIKSECSSDVVDGGASAWFLELKEFLTALNQSETCITLDLEVEGYSDVYSLPADPIEIREFCIEKSSKLLFLWSASSILYSIFTICRPQTITYRDFSDCEFPIRLYELLISRSYDDLRDGYSYFGLNKFWDVTGIEILWRYYASKDWPDRSNRKLYRRSLQLPQPSDRIKFLELLKGPEGSEDLTVSFNLEYVPVTGSKSKRLKTSNDY